MQLRRGIQYGYPLCCVLQFCIGSVLGVGTQARRRGIVVRGVRDQPVRPGGGLLHMWVPCIWHRRCDPDWRSYADQHRADVRAHVSV